MPGERFDSSVPKALMIYVLLQFALLLGMTTQFLGMAGTAGLPALLAYAFYLVAGLSALGALMERRHWALWLESARVLATALVPLLSGRWFGVAHLDGYFALAIAAVFSLSALALPWLGKPYAVVGAASAAN
jgi:alkylglycerol monooxygenase